MDTQLFSSIFTSSSTNVSVTQLVMSMVVSLGLGLLLAMIYKYKSSYTKEFVITLSLLPTLIAVIIFLVNGSLGTSVAVAGTFSLIRFRSAAGTSKELLAIFMATAIGLATGMGHLALAVVVTLVLGLCILIFENTRFAQVNQNRRHLLITVPQNLDYQDIFEQQFGKACKKAELLSIRYKPKKEALVLEYNLLLDRSITDKKLLDAVLLIEPLDVVLNKQAPKKKYL